MKEERSTTCYMHEFLRAASITEIALKEKKEK